MDAPSAVVAFSIAAALMTITPGLDTALVLRTATVEGPRPAMAAGGGVVTGVLVWGLLASLGLGAVLAVSEVGYRLLQSIGAAYLFWLGTRMVMAAIRPGEPSGGSEAMVEMRGSSGLAASWFWRGVLTNLLNPKVGVFYVSFLPQFIPADMPVVPFSMALAAIHAAMGLAWFAFVVAATRPFSNALRKPNFSRAVNGLTGTVLIGFGLRLALERRG
ncbi:LysE family translocator [Mesorhizobium sp. CAU 1741]|uniref:LysE family translocator n=1 Tax=Mesorhizobium sp. CAU 1741 TaxID=3140366 RepID=UPI00325B522F